MLVAMERQKVRLVERTCYIATCHAWLMSSAKGLSPCVGLSEKSEGNPFHAHAPTNCIQWKHRFASRAGGVHWWKKIHVRNLPITPSISKWEKETMAIPENSKIHWNMSQNNFSWDITSSNFHQWHLWGTVEPPFMDPNVGNGLTGYGPSAWPAALVERYLYNSVGVYICILSIYIYLYVCVWLCVCT